jgi:hypothetical protein
MSDEERSPYSIINNGFHNQMYRHGWQCTKSYEQKVFKTYKDSLKEKEFTYVFINNDVI